MSLAYRNRPEFRPEVRGSKTPAMLAAERRVGMELRLFIVSRSAEGWTVAQIAERLGIRPQTLASLWCRRLGLQLRDRRQILPA